MNWRACADELPPFAERVLLVRNIAPMWVVRIGFRDYVDKKGQHYCEDGGAEIAAEATHWMPLPGMP
jgi:hypothetical protein